MRSNFLLFASLLSAPMAGFAGGPAAFGSASLPSASAAGKWQFHLFNPAPAEFMRGMSTDRPDATESPITVDAGHFQIEASFFDFTRDRSDGVKNETWVAASINLKAGLLNNVDLQMVFDSHTEASATVRGHREVDAGFSDLQTRLKINLWGNDGGKTALALMPYVKFPTGAALSNDRWEGGVILPFGIEIAEGVGAGLMAEADFVYDEDSGGYETEWLHTATVGFAVAGDLGAFLEYMGVAGCAEGFQYQATCNAGLTYGLCDNVQLDAGVRIGLNDAAEDFGLFTGFSMRF